MAKVTWVIGLNAAQSEDKKETDWAEIYTTLLCHTNMRYKEIGERTILQLNAILTRLPKHLEIRIGIPGLFGFGSENSVGSGNSDQNNNDRAPKLSEIAAFCGTFNNAGNE